MSADAILASVTRDQWQHYLRQFAPLEEQLVSDIDSNELVERAANDAATQVGAGKASLDRSIARYGLNMTGAQRAQLERQRQLGAATNTAQSINTARIDQRERNLGVAADLMMKGRGVSSSAIDGLGQAAGLEAQRNAANAQAKAQSSAQTLNTALGVASLAMMTPW
jgi:hypothetical protein